MSIFDELKFSDIGIGNPQVVDEMIVVPLVGSDRGNVADPQALKFDGTGRGYGHMTFKNEDEARRPAIVPAHTTARSKNSGQDHTMPGVGIVPFGETTFSNCCCIEQSRPGRLEGEMDSFDVLPVGLRKAFGDATFRTRTEIGRLWNSISSWLRGLTPTGRAHLVDFYESDKYKERLERFSAEFEPVPGQIGAIIMFAGVPVGIEIMPTNKHWEAYWQYIIRGCYGAELVRLQELKQLKSSALIFPKIPDGANAEQAAEILSKFADQLKADIIPIINQIALLEQKPLSARPLKSALVKTTNNGVGDVVYQDESPIYVSIVL
jgi:hypothetical protein